MILIDRTASEEEILNRVRDWVELIANGNAEEAFDQVNLEGEETPWRPRHLQYILSRYHSYPYPGQKEFRVTSWKTAESEGERPAHQVVWYKPNDSFLAIVDYDLPLNGRWSDLRVTFALSETGEGDRLFLWLEDFDVDPLTESYLEEPEAYHKAVQEE